MSPLLVVFMSVGLPIAGVGLFELQARLEQWAQRRHADD